MSETSSSHTQFNCVQLSWQLLLFINQYMGTSPHFLRIFIGSTQLPLLGDYIERCIIVWRFKGTFTNTTREKKAIVWFFDGSSSIRGIKTWNETLYRKDDEKKEKTQRESYKEKEGDRKQKSPIWKRIYRLWTQRRKRWIISRCIVFILQVFVQNIQRRQIYIWFGLWLHMRLNFFYSKKNWIRTSECAFVLILREDQFFFTML